MMLFQRGYVHKRNNTYRVSRIIRTTQYIKLPTIDIMKSKKDYSESQLQSFQSWDLYY